MRVEKGQSGFTIVELLIVVVVIAILATITIVAYNGIRDRAQTSAIRSAIGQAVKKVQVYAAANSDLYPANASDAGLSDSGGTTYAVSSNNNVSPRGYCVTVTAGPLTYFQTSEMTAPSPGTCIGMLAWWPFNGNTQDLSGNGVDATANGAVSTTGTAGAANTAYQLGETNQTISVGSLASFSVIPSGFTYSVWLARTGTSTNQWPLIMGAADTHKDFGIRANNYGQNAYFEYGTSPYTGSSFSSAGVYLSLSVLNEWHLFTVTYDGATVTVYRDGSLSGSVSTALRPTMAGFGFTPPSSGWNGKVDDVRIYNRALSNDEIQALYKAGAY